MARGKEAHDATSCPTSERSGAGGSRGPVGGSGYNIAVATPRDEFPNNFVGDIVETAAGWVVLPPTYCPDGHAYNEAGWSVTSVWCTCNDRHVAWRCWCGKPIYAPQPGPHCRIRDIGAVSIWVEG